MGLSGEVTVTLMTRDGNMLLVGMQPREPQLGPS